jgi:addiction module RelB/DinJ family antitoxin
MCTTCRILSAMSLVPKSATIQLRVMPLVKRASEQVLWRIGLNMSEAVELFLRRVIVDERIPFDVIALEPSKIGAPPHDVPKGEIFDPRGKWAAAKKEFKKISGAHTPGHFRTRKAAKKAID